MRRNGFIIMAKLSGLVMPLLHIMTAAVLLGIAGYLCAIFIPILGGFGILQGLTAGLPEGLSLSVLIGLMTVFAILRGILHYAEQACNHYIAFKILAIIRHKVFDTLRKLAPAKLEGKDKGNLISVITSDIELLEVFYAHTISPILIAALTSGFMVYFIGRYHLLLGLVALAGYLMVGVCLPLVSSKLGKSVGMEYREEFGEMNSFLLDSVWGLTESIQYQAAKERKQQLNKRTQELNRQQKKLKDYEGRNKGITTLSVLFFGMLMLFVSSYLYQKGFIGFSGVLISVIGMISSFGPVIALSSLSNNLFLTLASGERVLKLLEEIAQVDEITGQERVNFSRAAVDQVSFSYGEEAIIDKLSLPIPGNQIIGINGRSGSGKSTLLKLLMRFWDTEYGRVSISGRNVKKINTKDLRNMEGYVTQETFLFQDTIAANIAVSKPDASMEEIIEAAKKASVHSFISSLAEGYETKVSALGNSLSGGEKQRIGIARALLHDAPFLLLDEPTSNLDSLNEGIILKALSAECKNKTVVLVSHRKSTMNIADQVYQMDFGRIS